jgi:zinc protease
VLDNGLVVLVRENHAAPVVVVDGLLPGGSVLDPRGKTGLASFTASMLTRGSAHYNFDHFNEIVESVGASVAAGADDHTLSFGSTSLSEDFPQMLTVLADMLRRPTFAPEHVQRVRSQKLVRIQEREEDTQELAGLRFYETIYPDHPYGRATSGYADTVAAITRDDLVAFHADRVTPNGGVIVVVGDVESQTVLELVQSHLGHWRGSAPVRDLPPIPTFAEVRTRVYDLPGKFQSDIYIGGPAVPRHHPDFFPIRIANTILGRFAMMGRLGENVREQQGLAYYVYSSQEAGPHAGLWYAAAGVNPANVDQAVESIQQEFARLAEEEVDEEELRDTQAYLTGILPLQLETNDGVAGTLLNMEWQGLGLDYLSRYNDLVNGVTAADVQRVARQYLRPDAYALVIAGPQTEP